MLIIAQPKTASHSLMAALNKVTKYPAVQEMMLKKNPSKYKRNELYNWPHSDAGVNLDLNLINKWSKEKHWYKQHLIPSENNLKFLLDNKIKAVIILRNIEDTMKSYQRAFDKINDKKTDVPSFKPCVEHFYNTYNQLRNISHFYFIDFNDVINNPNQNLQNILNFFNVNINVPSNFCLPKIHYSTYRRNL